MDWFFDSRLPILVGIFIGLLIAYPFVKRLQARKEAREKGKKGESEES